MGLKPYSVSQLNSYLKSVLSVDPMLANISVTGEVSNLTKHSSGHWYFSLKDANARINCFLAHSRIPSLRFNLSEGMQIIVHGYVSVYEKGGYFSLNVRDIDAAGEGALNAAFEALKEKLSGEGLFDEAHKRPIPQFPKKIGVVTSPTGAAIKDIITTLKRRSNLVDLILYPCLVQGTNAADSVCEAIEGLNKIYPDLDLLIVGRGGGSMEDLWTFNEESVARAVYASKIPVISAVGHEKDIVITDFVADLRAATPTAAAELAVPDVSIFLDAVRRFSPVNMFSYIEDRIERNELKIQRLKDSIDNSVFNRLDSLDHRLNLLKLDLDAANPMTVLDRGFAAVKNGNKWITSKSFLKNGDEIQILFKDGQLSAVIKDSEK